MSIDSTSLSLRVRNALKRHGIWTVEQFLELSEYDSILNIGEESEVEIMQWKILYKLEPESETLWNY